MRILITLPSNRNLTGALRVENDQGRVVAGPFCVGGRASDKAAALHANATRSPLLRYGDTPTGGYQVAKVLPTGAETPYAGGEFGSVGAIVLQGISGDAALAEANGRFHIFIQGGPQGEGARLRATNGSLRLCDKHLRAVLRAIGKGRQVSCEIVEDSTAEEIHLIVVEPDYDQGDPPLRQDVNRAQTPNPYSRRQFLWAATAAVAGIAVAGLGAEASQAAGTAKFVPQLPAFEGSPAYGYDSAPPHTTPSSAANFSTQASAIEISPAYGYSSPPVNHLTPTLDLSGSAWINRFPDSRDVSTLEPVFRAKAQQFLAALAGAHANIRIAATYRPPQRQYLMRYAWLIAVQHLDASSVPPMAGVAINWWHGTQEDSEQAAAEMVDGFGIEKLTAAPALDSRHNHGQAIDMAVSWTGTLAIANADGTQATIASIPTDGTNADLIRVGATYGVIHSTPVMSDPAYWSSDGL